MIVDALAVISLEGRRRLWEFLEVTKEIQVVVDRRIRGVVL